MPPSLFVNDGSFMERFKQLQQEQEKGKNAKLEDSKPIKVVSRSLSPNLPINKTSVDSKGNDTRKTSQAASGGKLAFSLKQRSKLVPPPVKLGADGDEEEIDAGDVSNDAPPKRQKLGQEYGTEQSSRQLDVGKYFLSFLVFTDSWRVVDIPAKCRLLIGIVISNIITYF